MISKRRKFTGGSHVSSSSLKKKRVDFDLDEEEVSSASEDEHDGRAFLHDDESSSEEEEEETVDAKRVRMARDYLEKLKSVEEQQSDDEDEHDLISSTLQRQRLQKQGTYHHDVADRVKENVGEINASHQDWLSSNYMTQLKGHDLTPTCVALSHSQPNLCVSGSKDHSVIQWDIETSKRVSYLQPKYSKQSRSNNQDRNGGEVLTIASSHNGNFVAVGKRDATVSLYDTRSLKLVTSFAGHKGPVTSLAFQNNEALFTGSSDRCIRHYNMQELAYIETLYGHQDKVLGLDCLGAERPVSVGRDRTARLWKLQEDSHLIFRGGAGLYSGECISYLNPNFFVTGHEQNGTVCLWNVNKKKAVCTIPNAHQHANEPSRYCSVASLAACKQSDFVLSGSSDGFLNLYKTSTVEKKPTLDTIGKIVIQGFLNGIAVAPDASHCVVAVGQEPRLGRWERIPKIKNRIHVVRLRREDADVEKDIMEEEEENIKEEQESSEEEESDTDDSSE